MPTPLWFDDLKTLAELPPDELVAELRELGEAETADAIELRLTDPDYDHGSPYVFHGSDELKDPYLHKGHVVGYVGLADSVQDPAPIVYPDDVEPQSDLIRSPVTLHLIGFRAAHYPGGDTHRVLFHFGAVHQWPDGVENLHFNTSRLVEHGDKAPNLDQPIFEGLVAGPRGLNFHFVTFKVRKPRDRKFLKFLESDVYRCGLQLLSRRQPVTALYSDMAYQLTQRVRPSCSAIHDCHLGLGLVPGSKMPLASGTYVVAQVPESYVIGFPWEDWSYHPGTGRIIPIGDSGETFGFNYLVFAVHRYREPWEVVHSPELTMKASSGSGTVARPSSGDITTTAFGTAKQFPSEIDCAPRVTTGGQVDLEIEVRVSHHQDRMTLDYVVTWNHGTRGCHKKKIRGPQNLYRPTAWQQDLLTRLETINQGMGDDEELILPDELGPRLARMGQRLYRTLFPEELKALYCKFRQDVTTLQITSDEPWIPWELVKPFDASEKIDDDFLGVKFQLTRWLTESRSPPSEIFVDKLACLEAGSVLALQPLPLAVAERAELGWLARKRSGILDASPLRATRQAVEQLLSEGGLGLVHFVGHGDCDPEKPDNASITLVDRSRLRAEEVEGEIAARVASDRPLIFFNACRVGRQGLALTGLDGWAPAWVRVAGCGAFIAPQWAVRDDLSCEFARVFYGALDKGLTFGQATQIARRHVRDLDPSNTTALAYAVYAHPNGRLRF